MRDASRWRQAVSRRLAEWDAIAQVAGKVRALEVSALTSAGFAPVLRNR
jgi:hypothetical protein